MQTARPACHGFRQRPHLNWAALSSSSLLFRSAIGASLAGPRWGRERRHLGALLLQAPAAHLRHSAANELRSQLDGLASNAAPTLSATRTVARRNESEKGGRSERASERARRRGPRLNPLMILAFAIKAEIMAKIGSKVTIDERRGEC